MLGSLAGSDSSLEKTEPQTPLPLLAARQDTEDIGGQRTQREANTGEVVGLGDERQAVSAEHSEGAPLMEIRELCAAPDGD